MLREYKLYEPVKNYFENLGYTVYPEIPIAGSNIDLVARKNNELMGVELKMSLTKNVIYQCYRNHLSCDLVYAAIPTKPKNKNVELCKRRFIGIICVKGEAEIILEAKAHPYLAPYFRERLLRYCTGIPFEDVGGLPNLKGEGPAQDCYKRVQEYIKVNPKTTWKEIYKSVINHYASVGSMYSALRIAAGKMRDK